MSIAHDLPVPYGEPVAPALRLVPEQPLDFDDAVRRLRPRLHRYAARRLGDVHEAEELVQEALLRAYTHRDELATEDDLSAWSTVVTGRLVIDRLRVRGRSTSVADVPENSRLGRDTADIVVGRDEARTALDALDAMPPRQASLLWAREVEGHSYEELCARFKMTEPAVRSVLTRARKALRKEYALRGGTLPVGGLAVLAPWIAGLTWADKLRAAVGRVTAPAALAAIGVTTLGGLILSPFGATPSPSPGTFSPDRAVVSEARSGAQDRLPHGSVLVKSGSTIGFTNTPAADVHPPSGQGGSPDPTAIAPVNKFNCDEGKVGLVNERQLGNTAPSVADLPSIAGAGCQGREGNEWVVDLNPAKVPNPTNVNSVKFQSNDVPCPDELHQTPVIRCNAQQGAKP